MADRKVHGYDLHATDDDNGQVYHYNGRFPKEAGKPSADALARFVALTEALDGVTVYYAELKTTAGVVYTYQDNATNGRSVA